MQINSTNLNDTLALAEQIGHNLVGGEVIELISDLGGGKTAFVRGLAKGMGCNDVVHSPSFTLSNEYRAGSLTLHHFDLYRLTQPGIMKNEIAEVLQNQHAVVAVEWANIVKDILPNEHLRIIITVLDENQRTIECIFPDRLNYLFIKNT